MSLIDDSEYTAVDAPTFERYNEKFDPISGIGGLEIWLPISRRTR